MSGASEATAQPTEAPRCKCGTDKGSKYAIVDRQYTFFGILYLLWGGTSVPSRVTFRCVKCGDAFDVSTLASVCRQHIK
jgi:hypothetical protein